MERTLVKDLRAHLGESVAIDGWVNAVRNQKNVQFVIVRDQTGMVQVTHRREEGDDSLAKSIEELTRESAIEVVGMVVHNDVVQLGQLEILTESINVLGPAFPELPIDEDSSLDNRLDWRYLDLRRPSNLLIFRVQTWIEHVMRQYWLENEFIEIHSPKLMGSASESGGELFKLDHFGQTAYLAQSPQFFKQMAMAAGFERVFEIAPVFRANPSFTSRHDTEFTSVDVEISWVRSHEDVMRFEEEWLHYVLTAVKEKYGDAISEAFGVEVIVPALPFPRVTMAEAYSILERLGHTIARQKGDLDPEGERTLARYVNETFRHEFVFVTDYPASARPFYHMRHAANPGLTRSFDLIWKGVEITTGAQREHRYDILSRQAIESSLSLEPIQYYLDFFKFGCPPHGGFGFGLTRMLMMLLGANTVREVTYLYRGPNRLSP